MKKFFRLTLLIVLMIFSFLLVGCTDSNNQGEEETIKYTLNSSGEATVTGCSADTVSLTLPASIDGHPIVAVGAGAFFNYSSLESVKIENGLTVIEERAFENCTSLKSVTLPDSVKSIGEYAFNSCTSLSEIKIGEDSMLEYIGKSAFYSCRSLEFNEYDNAKYISKAKNAYFILYEAANKEITDCEINAMAKIIASEAFAECVRLTKINVPENIEHIGESAFKSCTRLGVINFNAEIDDCSKENPIFEKAGSTAVPVTVTIGKNLTRIPSYLFASMPRLVSVVFESAENITSIGDGAFYKCTYLPSISLPKTVQNIGAHAFEKCKNMESITLDNTALSFIGSDAFLECDLLTYVKISDKKAFCECEYSNKASSPLSNENAAIVYNDKATSNLILPEGITKISSYAFAGYSLLSKIIIPKSVKEIEKFAFLDCDNLEAVYYSDTESAFNSLKIGEGNDKLLGSTVFYYSATQPTTSGNYWCYVNGVPGVWQNNEE